MWKNKTGGIFDFLLRSEAKIGVEITVLDMNNKSSIMFSFK